MVLSIVSRSVQNTALSRPPENTFVKPGSASRLQTESVCTQIVSRHFCCRRSHSFTVASLPPDIHFVPSPLMTTQRTLSVCPFKRPTFSPLRGSHIRKSPIACVETRSVEPDTHTVAALSIAKQYTESWWPEHLRDVIGAAANPPTAPRPASATVSLSVSSAPIRVCYEPGGTLLVWKAHGKAATSHSRDRLCAPLQIPKHNLPVQPCGCKQSPGPRIGQRLHIVSVLDVCSDTLPSLHIPKLDRVVRAAKLETVRTRIRRGWRVFKASRV